MGSFTLSLNGTQLKVSWLFNLKTAKQVGLISLMVAIGTIVDLTFHSSVPPYYLPPGFFFWCFFIGTFWGFIVYKIFAEYFFSPNLIAALVSLNVSFLFQSAYMLQGTDWNEVLVFLLLDFLLFFIPSVPIFNSFKKIFKIS